MSEKDDKMKLTLKDMLYIIATDGKNDMTNKQLAEKIIGYDNMFKIVKK